MTYRFGRIGIVTGVEAEADAFAPDLPCRTETIGPVGIRRLSLDGRDIVITCSGIGKVNAALAATMLASRYSVDLLMVIGTAGKLSDLAGDCFVLSDAVQADYGAWRGDGFAHYAAGHWPIGPHEFQPFTALPLSGLDLRTARIVTSDAFVECPDRSGYLRDALGADLVDMETAAVAQVADRFGLPWTAIKATTDDANGESAGHFAANLARAAALAADAARRAITALP